MQIVAGNYQDGYGIMVVKLIENRTNRVIDAVNQGIPTVAYNAHGLKDSVGNEKTGLIVTRKNSETLAAGIISLFRDAEKYSLMKHEEWAWSKKISFDNSYRQLIEILRIQMDRN